MSDKLRPCLFHKETKPIYVYCGEFESTICEDEEDYQDGNPGSAQCDCGASGPTDYSFDGCIAAWNTRPVEDALVEGLRDSLVWLILATSSGNPKQAENAMKQIRTNINALVKAGIDPEIRMEGLDEIEKEIRAALQKAGRA